MTLFGRAVFLVTAVGVGAADADGAFFLFTDHEENDQRNDKNKAA
jgi:hypothetical protein